jgi:hypothetical protein
MRLKISDVFAQLDLKGTVRIKKRTSYRACSCSSNTVVGKGGGWWAIGRRTSRTLDST